MYSCYRNFEIPYQNQIGELKQPRYQHSAIFNGREIMVVGGIASEENEATALEIWDIESMRSRTIEPSLTGYHWYPILYLVPYNFPNH